MPVIDMMATGANIKRLRQAAGMTITDITKACGITAGAVCKWQRGDAMPTIDNFIVLATIWNMKIDDIIVVR